MKSQIVNILNKLGALWMTNKPQLASDYNKNAVFQSQCTANKENRTEHELL